MNAVKHRVAKIARLAFHNQQARAEKDLMRVTAGARAEVGLIREAFGQDALPNAVKGQVKTLSMLERASLVRQQAITKTAKQLTPAERALADTLSRSRGKSDWMRQLAGIEKTIQTPPEAETRKAIGRLLRKDAAQVLTSPTPAVTAATEGKQLIEAYKVMTKVWATLENAPELLTNFQKTRRFRYSDVVWVSKQTGIDHARVQAIMDRLAKVAPERPYKLENTVFQRQTPNAFSAGGGQFGVHDSILKLAKTDDELAFIMGHELAHEVHGDAAAARLSLKRFQNWQERARREGVPKSVRDRVEEAVKQEQIILRRIQETRADRDGVRFAARAGFDPQAGAEFLNKLDPKPMADKIYLDNGYPPTRKRIEAIKAAIRAEKL
ncbi:MAG: M48 family metallopeptidase [Candidatus Sericytochromatia bacterium]|nr:M48 family metallopeptidase [Candidatus Sericytochromatia bacterium]